MDVVMQIAKAATTPGMNQNVPQKPIIIESVTVKPGK